MRRPLLSTALMILGVITGLTQTKRADSLLVQLKSEKFDTGKVVAMFTLCTLLDREDVNDDIVKYASEALFFAQKENYQRGIGISYYTVSFCDYAKRDYSRALKNISAAEQALLEAGDKINAGRSRYLHGDILYELENYSESIKYFSDALAIWQTIGYKTLAGSCTNDLARSYGYIGNYNKSIEYFYKALQLSEELGDKKEMARSLQYIGAHYDNFNDHETGLKYLQEAASLNLELGNKFDFAQNNTTIGEIYLEEGNYAEARKRFFQSLKIYEERGAPAYGINWCSGDIAEIYEKEGDSAYTAGAKNVSKEKYNEALALRKIILKRAEEIKRPQQVADNEIEIGKIYFKLSQLSMAEKYLFEALRLSRKSGRKEALVTSYLFLSQLDSAEHNPAKAYEHYKLYTLYRDSLFNNESAQELSFYKVQSDIEKEEEEIKLLSTQNKLSMAIAEKEKQRKKIIYASIMAILVFGSYGVYRYIGRKKLQNQQEVLKERLRISRELHDEVGSTLSGIAMYSHLTKQQINASKIEEVEKSLSNIQQSANDMIHKLSDIVWLVNPEKDSFPKLIERLEEFAADIARIKNMEVKINVQKELMATGLPVDKRRNIYLFCKEAITNAIKYSDAAVIELTIKELENGRIDFSISDDGKGFDPSNVRKGNGLVNMQQRAEEMNAHFSLRTGTGHGTTLTMTCKFT
ncbi:MAG TPA: histidine kinase [Chitinophagaceae bacterium]|nr:histidine kinase [Chitinophagaceae bacterium]